MSSGRLTSRCAAVAAALLAGCGGLDTPDLAHGEIVGALGPVSSGAHVYVLGRTELRADVALDGTFVLGGVPPGAVSLVALDGADRAGLVACTVVGGERTWVGTWPEVAPGPPATAGGASGGLLLPAGSLAATVRLTSGVSSAQPRFTVVGTELADMPGDLAAATLLRPLPAGAFRLRATLTGYLAREVDVQVVAGATTAVEVALDVDPAAVP